MNEQEFNELLDRIKNNIYTSIKLAINMDFFDASKFHERLNDDKTILLCEALKKNSYIKEVELIGNDITDLGAIALSKVNSLTELNLYGNNVEILGAKALAESSLSTLSLQENCLTTTEENNKQLEEMIEAFVNNSTIKSLNLRGCYIPEELASQLISKNQTIKQLDLSRNSLKDKAFELIQLNSTLESLILYGNDITDLGAKVLSQNQNLKYLDITKNSKVTLEGLKYFIGGNLNKILLPEDNFSTQEVYDFYYAFEKIKKTNDGNLFQLSSSLQDQQNNGLEVDSQDLYEQSLQYAQELDQSDEAIKMAGDLCDQEGYPN